MSKLKAPVFLSVIALEIICFIASAALFGCALLLPVQSWLKTFMYAAGAALVCYDLAVDAVALFLKGRRLDPRFLIIVSVAGVFAAGAAVQGAAAILIFRAGVLLQTLFTEKYGHAVGSIIDQRPEAASAVNGGAIARTPIGKLRAGDVISVSPGERVALDGTVVSGESAVDESLQTGAAQPRQVARGSAVTGGSLNLSGVLNIRAESSFDDGDAMRILGYVSGAGRVRSGLEKLLARISRIYTPAVVGAAVIAGVLVPLIGGLPFGPWLLRGLTLLMLATLRPAAASAALAYFAGVGGAAVKGIVFKGAGHVDTLARATSVVFAKTGTLTSGFFRVTDVNPNGFAPERLMTMAAYAELGSEHPMAKAVVAASNGIYDRFRVSDFKEYPGMGVEAEIGGVTVSAGNGSLMSRLGITPDLSHTEQSVVYVAVNGRYAGRILLSDEVKQDAKKAVRDLHLLGVDRIVIFTGDKKAAAAEIAGVLGVTEFYAECLPEDKAAKIKTLLEMQLPGDKLVYAGDGAADAAVMRAADLGIALDGFYSAGAEGDTGLVVMTDEVSKVPEAVMLARGTVTIARQNIMTALAMRALVIVLALAGLLPIWVAMLAEALAATLTMLNATRAAGFRRSDMRRALVKNKARPDTGDQETE